MAFNWFRRQFQPEDAPESPAEQASPATSESPSGEGDSADAVQEDYLAWAKAAYQNIQQRQQPVAATETAETETVEIEGGEAEKADPEIPDPSPQDAANPDVLESDAAVLEGAETAESLTKTEAIASTPSSDSLTDETAAVPEGSSVEDSPAEPSSNLPLWARADAERQARLERLKATAIETVEASVTPAPQSIAPSPAQPRQTPAPGISSSVSAPAAPPDASPDSLDEGFLWSAEVLAAQGRRPDEVSADEITWLQKLRKGLDKTRLGLVNQLKTIVGKGPLTQEAVMEIEALLLQADVGVGATDTIIEALQQRMLQETLPPDEAIAYLKKILRDILDAPFTSSERKSSYSPVFTPTKDTLNIWLMTGVNGAGKTTTIGKLAYVAKESGYVCLIAAADTFRAAAVEQVKVWAGRSGVEVIANPGQNTDPAAVVFDAITAAQSRNIELLLVDTAGRLQNKKNLMDELRKVRQVIEKKAPQAKVESLLVLDATLGQNGLRQAQVFAEAAQLSGVVLTKLDGTAKGGVALAVVQQLGLPIRFIGAGEGIKDLRPFSSYEFVEALLSR